MNILLAGGTGLIGKALLKEGARRGHTFTLLAREPKAIKQNFTFDNVLIRKWDTEKFEADIHKDEHFHAIINLSGENIAEKRWTKRRKNKLLQSRIDATKTIVSIIYSLEHKPHTLINSSAIGYYEPKIRENITETNAAGSGFIPDLCKLWEQEAYKAKSAGVRTIVARTAMVLAKEGGALSKMLPAFRLGLGAVLGSGNQYMSWISLHDCVAAFFHVLESENIQNEVNFTSVSPVTNLEFSNTLAQVLHRPLFLKVPSALLKILLGEMTQPLLLDSLPVIPEKLLHNGFTFKDIELRDTLNSIIN